MTKLFTSLLLVTLAIGVLADDDAKKKDDCDRILVNMVDACKGIRNSLISLTSLDQKNMCCTNARYNICVQGVKGYVTVAKTTRICDESVYEKHVDSLTSNLAMEAVTKRCEKFDEKTCVTDTLSNVWSQIQSGGQQLGDTISKNFNEAVDSLSTFAKNVGSQIQAQNITERLKESATTLQKSLTERGREFGDMVSGQSLNRYSLVDGDRTGAESSQSFSFNSFINSLVPSIEVVEKSRPEPVAQGTEHVQKMFNSLISIFKPSNAASVQQPIQEPKSKATVGDNPYNVIQ